MARLAISLTHLREKIVFTTNNHWQKLRLAGIAVLAAIGSGCASEAYLNNDDTVTLGVGDAVAANRVAQTINPTPPVANRTTINSDGNRILTGTKLYEKNESKEPESLNTSDVKGSGGSN